MSNKNSNYDSQMSSKNRSPEQDDGSLSSQGKSPAGYGDRQVIQQQEMGGELGSVNPQQEQDSSMSSSSQPDYSSMSDSSSMNTLSQSEQSECSSESECSEDSSIEQSKSYSTKENY